MTSSERKLIIGGVALGAVLAVAAMQIKTFLPQSSRPIPAVAEPSKGDPVAEGAFTVELSDAEQRAIGVQTSEVRPQIIARKIQTTGRVENADLSRVRVQADFFESDIPMIRIGQTAKVSSSALQGGPVTGVVSYVKATADPDTRTFAARVQIENPQGQLRPGMFVQVSIDAPLNEGIPAQLAVPRSAVLDTGNEKVVYVARGDGVFEKRSVVAGAVGDEFYSVTQGLQAGERVVTQGNFLLDSQTRLTGNITGMFGGSKAFGEDTATEPAGSRSTITFKVDPSQPKGGAENTFHVTVSDPTGKPVTDAQVQVMLVMPAMPSMGMGEMRSSYKLTWNGSEYVGKGTISMAGPWNVSVDARRGNQSLGSYKTHVDAK